jgi:hypothetical protein
MIARCLILFFITIIRRYFSPDMMPPCCPSAILFFRHYFITLMIAISAAHYAIAQAAAGRMPIRIRTREDARRGAAHITAARSNSARRRKGRSAADAAMPRSACRAALNALFDKKSAAA